MSKQHKKASSNKSASRPIDHFIETELMTPDQWIERYGQALGIKSADYVRQMCRGDHIGPSHTVARLPEGWQAKKFGNAWMIFKSNERSKP
jgi:hypothetical protein